MGKPVLTIYLNWLIGVFVPSSISNPFPQAPVTPAQTAQPVLPNAAPGGIVSLKA